jgi:hypothetical protein
VDRSGKTVLVVPGHVNEFSEGMAVQSIEGQKQSFIDRQGTVVIKPQFDYAYPFSCGLAAVRSGRSTRSIYQGDSWGYINHKGIYQIEPRFNEARPFRSGIAKVHVGGVLSEPTHMSFWNGGEWWLIDTDGNKLKSWKSVDED